MRLVIEIKKEDGFFDAELQDKEGVPFVGVSHKDPDKFAQLVSQCVLPQVLAILG